MTELTHKEVLERFTTHWEADRDNRDDRIDDIRFRAGDQWPDAVRQSREREGRPVITINRMGQFIKRVSGSLRQSHPAIDPFPVDDQSDPIIADIYAGIIRQIEYTSGASSVYSWGAECAISCGQGHWQIKTRYEREGFDQEIYLCRIIDPNAVTWDSGSVEMDNSDAYECFVTEMITEDEYFRRHPELKKEDKTQADFPQEASRSWSQLYWREEKKVRVASRWWKQPKKRKIGMNAEGQIFDISTLPSNVIAGLKITRTRDIDDHEIMHQPMSGDDFLSDPKPWAGSHIPIVTCYGEEIPLDGRLLRHGIIRWAKDPQRLYNYWRSAAAEMIALAPKAPWLVPHGMISGLEGYWNRANTTNFPYLPYKPDERFPQLQPRRQEMAQPPAAMWNEATIAQDDMKASIGIYDAALGQKSNETSGVAIEARQQEADTGSFVYMDNFEQAMRSTGQKLVDLIPKVYDGERVVRILGANGDEAFAVINKTVPGINGPQLINDISTSKFDVRIKVGPSYANAKAEAKQAFVQILQANPQLINAVGDLWVDTLDIPPDVKAKMMERMKKIVPPQLTGEPVPPDPLQGAQLAQVEAETRLKQSKSDEQVMKNQVMADQLGISEGNPQPVAAPVKSAA